MNPNLIEEITKLVIEKLQENESNTHLSTDEIADWNKISNRINHKTGTNNFSDSHHSNQLTDNEIDNWLEITSTFSTGDNKNNSVKIRSYK